MKCDQAREFLHAFLDDDLDSARSLEVQQHLEHCPACARDAEIERTISERLTAVLDAPIPALSIPGDTTDSGAAAHAGREPHRNAYRRIVWPAASLAAALLLAVSVWMYVHHVMTGDPGLAQVVVADLDHVLNKAETLHVTSSDGKRVREWLKDQTKIDVELPASEASIVLVGARRCSIGGQPAAFVLYHVGEETASLLVVRREAVNLTGMNWERRDGQTLWSDRCDGRNVVAVERGDLVYAAAARAPSEELVKLVTPAVKASP